jgi:hypothetical protein
MEKYAFTLVILFFSLLPTAWATQSIDLIRDCAFSDGLNIKDHSGKEHRFSSHGVTNRCVWSVAQHYSRSCFADLTPLSSETNLFLFQDPYEFLVIGSSDGNFISGVNGSVEYDGKYRVKGDAWPHLLLEQNVSDLNSHPREGSPCLSEMSKINFSADVKLLYDHQNRKEGYDPSLHAAQFQIFFTVQNLNPNSKGFGDYYWFGVGFYDDRKTITSLSAMKDMSSPKKKGTNKFIYNVGIKPFTEAVVGSGEWVSVHGDLYPHIIAGLHECWENGYLGDSKDLDDYRLGSLNIGWEVTGLNDVAMAVKGLRTEGILRDKEEKLERISQ